MTATMILWGHALAALLFGTLALAELQRAEPRWPRRSLVAALALTALWALAVAGIDARDLIVRLLVVVRDLAWLGFMVALRRRRPDRIGRTLAGLYAVVALVMLATALLAVLAATRIDPAELAAIGQTRLALRMMAAAGALILLHHGARRAGPAQGGTRLALAAIAAMWGMDLVAALVGYLAGWPAALIALRGFGMAAVAALLTMAGSRDDGSAPTLSRSAALRSLTVAAALLYGGATALVANLAATIGGDHARAYETAVVFGATAGALTLISSPWLRAWAKVKVAKHLFRHRYDYRTEWQRFAATLGHPDQGSDPLGVRIVKAVADLTDSPAGQLLAVEGSTMIAAAGWNWPLAAGETADAGFVRHCATGRIVALDMARVDAAAEGGVTMPDWLRDDPRAWVVVPLLHGERLTGAIVLARPPVDRPLDWEDLDLLRVAGRQAASYLAEDRAHAALADAARFDEFNRRFAFLLHDIKNVASQLTLVARNAERHADNPEFRADMVETLRDSAGRMTVLLARLGQHDASRPEPLQPVDVAAMALRAATVRRAQHAIHASACGTPLALASPARLEQVLGHLIQNAVEASAPDRPVRVHVAAADGGVAIEVIDRGCGMAPGFVRDQLFRPFASTKPSGFGIGAYEARQLVSAMGGTLDVWSREGEGTRFRILLPAAPAVEPAMEQAA